MTRRPLSERLRVAAERLDFVGDQGDREAVLEAAAVAAEREAPAQQALDAPGVCAICGEPIDSAAERQMHEEQGWTVRRDAGGTNALRGRVVTGRRAHAKCVDKAAAVGASQGELL